MATTYTSTYIYICAYIYIYMYIQEDQCRKKHEDLEEESEAASTGLSGGWLSSTSGRGMAIPGGIFPLPSSCSSPSVSIGAQTSAMLGRCSVFFSVSLEGPRRLLFLLGPAFTVGAFPLSPGFRLSGP